MTATFFIPKNINVGFRERGGTYTGKLAYVTYFDEKGKLRKETSWNGWRDKKIDNQIHENEPTSGFVLNKKAGGYSSGWNHRQTYVRVYDPRGFEFEITVPNLLYILENSTSTKGKGLEGEFIYGWDRADLVLIPVDSPDYQELVRLNELRHSEKKIGARSLVIGGTYRTRENQEWIYMGKFDEYGWGGEKKGKTKSFWFYQRNGENGYFERIKSVPQKLVEVISEECVEDYADIFDKMEKQNSYSPVDDTKDEFILYTKEEIEEIFEKNEHGWYRSKDVYALTEERIYLHRDNKTDEFYYEIKNPDYNPRNYWTRDDKKIDTRYYIRVSFTDVDDLLERFKPMRKQQYLANGKLYSEGY